MSEAKGLDGHGRRLVVAQALLLRWVIVEGKGAPYDWGMSYMYEGDTCCQGDTDHKQCVYSVLKTVGIL